MKRSDLLLDFITFTFRALEFFLVIFRNFHDQGKRLFTFFTNEFVCRHGKPPFTYGDLCKTSPFAQFLRQTQILILEILNVCLWLKSSSSLNLNKIEHFSKVSDDILGPDISS